MVCSNQVSSSFLSYKKKTILKLSDSSPKLYIHLSESSYDYYIADFDIVY